MRNPYEVLEIREGASEDEIKRAYKRMVKKYHPDQYANNPLSDLAEEKLKEINEAYDHLLKNKGGSRSSRQRNNWDNDQYNNSSSSFIEIRRLIERNDILKAEKLLDGIFDRNAEWHFLKGVILLKKGWYDQGYNHINNAVNMDPNNPEYRAVLNNMSMRNRGYRNVGNNRGYRTGPSTCEICQCLICTDCCCECMGSDFISCC